jgi:hypothetical protein
VKRKIYSPKFVPNRLDKRKGSASKTERSNELEVAGFLARIREGFQTLVSGVLLRNKRRFKASFLAHEC